MFTQVLLNPFAWFSILVALVAVFTARLTLQRRAAAGALSLALMLLAGAVWAFFYGLELASTSLPPMMFWVRLQYFGITTIPVFFLIFVLQYTGRDRMIPGWLVGLKFVIPAAVLLAMQTNSLHHLVHATAELDLNGPIPLMKIGYGPAFWVNAIYGYSMVILGALALLEMYLRSPAPYRQQAGIILGCALFPIAANIIYLTHSGPVLSLDFTPHAFIIAGIGIHWGVYRFKLFDLMPMARNMLVDNLSAGMLAFDHRGRLIDLNPAARRFLQFGDGALLGLSSGDLLARWPELVELLEKPHDTYIEIAAGPALHLQARRTTLRDRRGRINGHLVSLVDITERIQSAQQGQASLQRLSLINDISITLSRPLELPAVLQTVVSSLAKSLKVEQVGVALFDVQRNGLFIEAEFLARGASSQMGLELPVAGNRSLESILASKGPLFLRDAQHNPLLELMHTSLAARGVQSCLLVPLIVRDRVFGIIIVDMLDKARELTAAEIELAQTVANLAAVRIEQARLLETERRRVAEMADLVAASLEISRPGELSALHQTIADRAVTLLAAQGGCLYLCEDRQLTNRRIWGRQADGETIASFRQFAPPNAEGEAALVAQTGLMRMTSSTMPMRAGVSQPVLSVPIAAQEKVVGVLQVFRPLNQGPFTTSQTRMLTLFASHAATALQNHRLLQEVQRMASVDELTGLYNRRGLYEIGNREVDRARRFHRALTTIFLDIDHFKQFNDDYSYAVGDQVLRSLSLILRQSLREIDLIGRYGGEEFVLLLPESDLGRASLVAERLRQNIQSSRVTTTYGDLSVTVSVGIAELRTDSRTHEPDTLAFLIERAGLALHNAKEGGRNIVST